MHKHFKIISISTLALVSLGAVLATVKARSHGLGVTVRNVHKNTPKEDLIEKEHSLAFSTGVEAFRKGDLRTAEASFLRATQLWTNDDFSQSFLAQVYQLEGNKNLALDAYRSALSKPNGRVSSVTEDPRILAGYGDVCEDTGDRPEAKIAYAAAASGDDYAHSNGSLRSLLTENFSVLKRRAHAAAAARCRGVGDRAGAERHLRLGIQSDPKSWETHLALATVLRLEGKTKEATTSGVDAEKLAGKNAPFVRQQRERLGLIHEHKYFGYVKGKLVQIPKPPSDEQALAKLKAEESRRLANSPPPTPYQLEQALKGIRMAKAQFAKDPTKVKELENAERNIQAALNKAKPAK